MDSRVGAAVCAAGIGLAILANPWAASAETADSNSASESSPSDSSNTDTHSDATDKANARPDKRSQDDSSDTEADDSDPADEAAQTDEEDAPDEVEDETADGEGTDEDDAEDEAPAETVTDELAEPSPELPATTAPTNPVAPAAPVTELGLALARRTEAQAEADETPVVPPVVNATTETYDVGNGPSSVTLSPDGTLAYVTNLNNGTVSVVYVATGEVISTIDIGANPSALALSRDGSRAYTANPDLGTVSVIDTATATVVTSIKVGISPSSIAVSPSGARVYVTNTEDGTVSVINTATHAVIATIRVGGGPSALAVSDSGRRIYVANYDTGTVSVINTALNLVVGSIRVGGNPGAITLSPNGRRLYIADTTGGAVSIASTFFLSVITDAPIYVGGLPSAITVSPDGDRVYVTNLADDTVSVIDAVSRVSYASLATGQAPAGIVLSADGKTAYVTNSVDGTMTVIDTTKVPDGPDNPTPAGRTSTEGFTVINVTGKPITFLGYSDLRELPYLGGPGIGYVIPPGGSLRFEVIYNFLKTTSVYPRFELGPGEYWNVKMTVGTVAQTTSSCTAPGSSLQCKITSDVPGDQKFISLLDAKGTVSIVEDLDRQAQLLNQYCRQGSLGTCTFKIEGPREDIYGPEHQVGATSPNPLPNPKDLEKTLTIADAVTTSDSVTVTGKVSIGFLDKIINAELTQAYGHTWSQTRTFTETYKLVIPPGYVGRLIAQQPMWRTHGVFEIVTGNTVLRLTGAYVDTPNTDPNANSIYTPRITPIEPTV